MSETPAERTARLALDLGRADRKLAEAREEIEEYSSLLTRQGDLLTGVANALKGPPPELTSWSHHDLPELAAAAAHRIVRIWQERRDEVSYACACGFVSKHQMLPVDVAACPDARHADPDTKNPDALPLAAASTEDQEGT
jgi:hypothetical protein